MSGIRVIASLSEHHREIALSTPNAYPHYRDQPPSRRNTALVLRAFPLLLVIGDAYPFTGQLLVQEYDSLLFAAFAGWAGGFNDPEGFIALLPTFLVKDFATYIGPELAEKYKRARQEENWTARSELFQQINERLRKDQLMVPGWRIPFFIIGQPNLIAEEATFRYTPRLHLVREL